jgi:hypothetical protein
MFAVKARPAIGESEKRDLRGETAPRPSRTATATKPAHAATRLGAAMCGRTGPPARGSPPPAPGPRPRASSAREGCPSARPAPGSDERPAVRLRATGGKGPGRAVATMVAVLRPHGTASALSARSRGSNGRQARIGHVRSETRTGAPCDHGQARSRTSSAHGPVQEDARQRQVEFPRRRLGGTRLRLEITVPSPISMRVRIASAARLGRGVGGMSRASRRCGDRSGRTRDVAALRGPGA